MLQCLRLYCAVLAMQQLPADNIMDCLWSWAQECDIMFDTGSIGDWSLAQQLPHDYSSDVQRTDSSQHAAPAQQVSLDQHALTSCSQAWHLHQAVLQLPNNQLEHVLTARQGRLVDQ